MKFLPALCLLMAPLLPLRSSLAADAPADPVAALEQRVEQMQQQLTALQQQLQQLKSRNEAPAAQEKQAQTQQAAPTGQAAAAAGQPAGGISPDLSLWGYGEVYYTHPVHDNARSQFDLARAVFGIGYRFDDSTLFNSEYEVEHAVASATDKGEFEVEQFYIDRQLNDRAGVKAGLLLMPFGLLNEHHEPTNFYGVQRNFVETLIIPSTWREGGVALHGATDYGLKWDLGVTTGLDLGGWNNNPENPQYRTALDLEDGSVAPMQAMHQELALSNARNLSQYLSLNYTPVPGVLAGAAAFTGKLAIPVVPAGLPDSRITLWETHARWTPGAADISAVYARGQISRTATYNLDNAGVANPLPAQFLGYYLQAAYTLWQTDSYRFSPFARWERYDMGHAYEGIPQGFTTTPAGLASDGLPWPRSNDRVWTFGANFYLDPHIVLKADYQVFGVNKDFSRFDLGLGLAF
ncbi:MAG TPA: porin [Steroidobacteraceae bacterium]|nr:porin [Steroidobacteraceae bacterium]